MLLVIIKTFSIGVSKNKILPCPKFDRTCNAYGRRLIKSLYFIIFNRNNISRKNNININKINININVHKYR